MQMLIQQREHVTNNNYYDNVGGNDTRDHQLSGIVEDNNRFQNDNGSINHIRYNNII